MKSWRSGFFFFQLLDLRAASHITSHKSVLPVKQNISQGTNILFFFSKIWFVLNIMHVYKIKTQYKLHRTTLRVSVDWIHWEHSWLWLPRWNHPLLQGFHCCGYFCAMEQDRGGETPKAESSLCGEESRGETSAPHPTPPCLLPGPSQSVLRCFASRLGYRAWMSWLMDTKQRCPWWRSIRKTRKHSGFKHTHPSPLLNDCFSSCLTRSVCACLLSVCVEDEAREGAVLVVVAAVGLAAIQLDVNLIPCVQMEDDAVGGVVVVLVSILGDGAGANLK